jgi:hypothetical protein
VEPRRERERAEQQQGDGGGDEDGEVHAALLSAVRTPHLRSSSGADVDPDQRRG